MNKFLRLFALSAAIAGSTFAYADSPKIISCRGLTAALETSKLIQNYLRRRSPPSPELFLELIRLAELTVSDVSLNGRITELLSTAETVANSLGRLDPETKKEAQPILEGLLRRFSARTKGSILIRIFDRLWFWTPAQLDFLARMVRNDNTQWISTQLLWVLEQATPSQRDEFFSQSAQKIRNEHFVWFQDALALKYDRPVDVSALRQSIKAVNPDFLKPAPRPMELDGVKLQTSEDFYYETKARLEGRLVEPGCRDIMNVAS